jgi:hypothetical protein
MVACPGSLGMERNAPSRQESDDAREGTAAHWVAEMVLKGEAPDTVSLIDRFAPNKVCITAEMVEYVDTYVDHIRGRGRGFWVEQEVEYPLSPDIMVKGTLDSCTVDGDTLYVDDLKYGYRLVDPVDNWQLTAYAIGAAIAFKIQPKFIVMSIVQPRPYSPSGKIRSWTISLDELNTRFEYLRQAAIGASQPGAPLVTGSQCQYCNAFLECPAAQRAGMNAVDVVMAGSNDVLSPQATSMELTNLYRAKAVIDARLAGMEESTKEKIRSGVTIPGWTVERSLGNTRWNDGLDPAMLELLFGIPVTEPKMITPAAAKKKGVAEVTIKAFTHRPDNGFKLVPIDVDRKAKEMFGNG